MTLKLFWPAADAQMTAAIANKIACFMPNLTANAKSIYHSTGTRIESNGLFSLQTLCVGDYLPDTVPFAQAHFANTVEVYFCDWEFGYNNAGSGGLGCQNQPSSTLSNAYAGVLSNP